MSSSYSMPALPISYLEQWKVLIYFCRKEENVQGGRNIEHEKYKHLFCDDPWRRRKKHFLSPGPKFFSLRVPNWRRRCPRPKAGAPRPFSVLQPFLPSRLIKHDLCPPLPLARIYCTASIRKFWKYQSVFPKYQSLCLQSSLLIGSAEAYLKISRNRIKILFLS